MGKPRRARKSKPRAKDGNPYGGRELAGDELRAARAADILASQLERNAPFPNVSDDVDADSYVAALKLWRAGVAPIETALRRKGRAARRTATAIRTLMKITEADTILLPDLRANLERALGEIAVYEMFTAYALQLGCRKGGNKADKSDQAIQGAAFQLYCKGLSRVKIAKVLGVDRREVTKWLASARPIVEGMRDFLGLRKPPLGE